MWAFNVSLFKYHWHRGQAAFLSKTWDMAVQLSPPSQPLAVVTGTRDLGLGDIATVTYLADCLMTQGTTFAILTIKIIPAYCSACPTGVLMFIYQLLKCGPRVAVCRTSIHPQGVVTMVDTARVSKERYRHCTQSSLSIWWAGYNN